MHLQRLASRLLLAALTVPAIAQQPGTTTGVPAPAQQGTAVVRAFVGSDGSRSTIAAAAAQILAEGAEGRAKFTATVRAIAAVAPKPQPKPEAKTEGAPAPAPAPAAPAPAAAVEFADPIKQQMTAVVSGDPEAAKVALARLAEDKEGGPAALARLDERGKAILARCLGLTLRRKMETSAVFAGQYDELRDFQPEAVQLLLAWAQVPPKDVARADEFRTACLRAVRDVLPGDQADDTMRQTLRDIAGKAQHTGNQALFLTAICALHQYGDPSLFDQVKGSVEKQAASDQEEARVGAANMLAELHYQLRKYEEAAAHYKVAVAMLEKAAVPPQGLPTTVYNTACSLSLAKQTDDAFVYLEKALQLGVKSRSVSKAMIDADHDMNNLRADPRFAQMMEQYFGKANAGK